jgi:hypothetical protein
MMLSHWRYRVAPRGSLRCQEFGEFAKGVLAWTGPRGLGDRFVDFRDERHGLVEFRVGALPVAPHKTQIARVFVAGDKGTQLADKAILLARPRRLRQPRDRGKNIDGRVTSLFGDGAVEDDMSPAILFQGVQACPI